MPTYTQLEREWWWGAEVVPPALVALSNAIRVHFGLPPGALGSKGDNNHLAGYHRSAAWIRNSRYCTNRAYSVTETTGNRKPGDPNWICADDIALPRDQLLAACQRLDAAVRSGRLEKVTEWYGNTDGDNRVDGYDNIRNVVASSDDTHLWHLHISIDRGRANEDHSDLVAILTGGDDVALPPDFAYHSWAANCRMAAIANNTPRIVYFANPEWGWAETVDGGPNGVHDQLVALGAAPGQPMTPEQIEALTGAVKEAARAGGAEALNGATIHPAPAIGTATQ